jgi:hypothetical protein
MHHGGIKGNLYAHYPVQLTQKMLQSSPAAKSLASAATPLQTTAALHGTTRAR